MKNVLEKQVAPDKPISPTLRKMELYDKEYFIIEKMRTVRSAATDLKTITGKVWKAKQLNDERLLEVTRIA